jgi:ABC-type protease/lipase transport system fused ATPase/permease subunit
MNGSVAANISRFGDHDSEAITTAAQIAGVHEMILALPDGYETHVGDGGRSLSGGQRQRIALARAVYGDVRLVVLDEPNANLDQEGVLALRRTLEWLKQSQRTAIVISHTPAILGTVDRLLVLRNGGVERFGPRDQILAEMTRSVPSMARPNPARQTEPVREMTHG